MSLGVRDRLTDSALITRAREALAAGPLNACALMERVCSLPGAPERVAERLAEALFTRHPDFARDETGRWCLAVAIRSDPRLAAAVMTPGASPPRGAANPPARRTQPAHSVHADDAAMPLHSLRFAVVDVETTGSSPRISDRVTEIAIVHVDGGEVTELYETLVNPERAIPPAIMALTHITWEMVRDAPRFADVSSQVVGCLRERVFVAHNATYDWHFVSWEVGRASGLQLAGERLCTVRLTRALLPQLARRSLDSVTRYFGVENRARHRAGGDAFATAHVLTRLLRVAEDRGIETWGALSALLSNRQGRGRRRRRSALPHSVSVDPT